jgi:hypothetical protein
MFRQYSSTFLEILGWLALPAGVTALFLLPGRSLLWVAAGVIVWALFLTVAYAIEVLEEIRDSLIK